MEGEQSFDIKSFIITFICAFITCLAAGFIFHFTSIFNYGSRNFIITTLAFTGALILSLMKYRNNKESVLVLCVILILHIIITRMHIMSFIIRDIVISFNFWLAIYVYMNWLYNISDKYKFIRAIGLGIVTAILFVISGIFLVFINIPLERINIGLIFDISVFYLHTGLITGTGLVLGNDISEFFFIKNNKIAVL